ncbi:ATP-binding protein [Nonomuraea sp. NPDC050790]|uniref:ATP-binding protein n=1 Tax=Nonomuraea sp. NPDC050790 TaxID=3364371 RepID=UPI00378B7EFE
MTYCVPPSTKFEKLGVIHLACCPRAPYLARQAITRWLGGAHAAVEGAVLVASELVTNAVKYADASGPGNELGQVTLTLSQNTALIRLGVTDPGSRCSIPACIPLQAPNVSSENGRGLAIVENLSRGRWGTYRMPRTGYRHVWCHLDRDPSEAQLEELYCARVAG